MEITKDSSLMRSPPSNPAGLSGRTGWLVYVLPYVRDSHLFTLSCPNGESAEEMTARVDCVIRDVGSVVHPLRG